MIQALILIFLGIIATLVSLAVGLLGYIILKLFKKELNLKIEIKSDKNK